MKYKVNEIFYSIQGEGLLIGRKATFLRLQGCSVGCPWCDSGPLADEIEGKRRTNGMTANTWGSGGEWMYEDDIFNQILDDHLIITGGEPTLWDLDAILKYCQPRKIFTQLETSGQNKLKGVLKPDWITWSPKEQLGWQAPMSIKDLAREVKFVIDQRITTKAIQTVVDYYHYEVSGALLREFVLMPEGCPPDETSIGRTLSLMNGPDIDWHHFPVRMGLRAQYYLKMR